MVDYMIDTSLRIANGAVIKHQSRCTFGKCVAIDVGVYSSVVMQIGNWVHIAPYVVIIGGENASLTMEDYSGLASGTKVICAGDDFSSGALMNPQIPIAYRQVINKPVILKKFSCAGVNSVIMPGVIMAEGSVLGANSVLTEDTDPWTIYIGSPARPIKLRPKELAYQYAKELDNDISI
jgi:galactoside O-acetyltransferase